MQVSKYKDGRVRRIQYIEDGLGVRPIKGKIRKANAAVFSGDTGNMLLYQVEISEQYFPSQTNSVVQWLWAIERSRLDHKIPIFQGLLSILASAVTKTGQQCDTIVNGGQGAKGGVGSMQNTVELVFSSMILSSIPYYMDGIKRVMHTIPKDCITLKLRIMLDISCVSHSSINQQKMAAIYRGEIPADSIRKRRTPDEVLAERMNPTIKREDGSMGQVVPLMYSWNHHSNQWNIRTFDGFDMELEPAEVTFLGLDQKPTNWAGFIDKNIADAGCGGVYTCSPRQKEKLLEKGLWRDQYEAYLEP